MEDKLVQFLKSFRSIEPDAGFRERTRRILVAVADRRSAKSFARGFAEDVLFGSALVLASVVAVFSLAGFATFSATRGARADLTNLNADALRSEAQALDFSVHLGEATYFEESAKEVAVILREISESDSPDTSSN